MKAFRPTLFVLLLASCSDPKPPQGVDISRIATPENGYCNPQMVSCGYEVKWPIDAIEKLAREQKECAARHEICTYTHNWPR